MAEKNQDVQEPKALSVEELRERHNARLDTLVAQKKARSRRHAQFLINAGAISA